MSAQFPGKLDPWCAARTGQCLEGTVAACVFTRIPSPGRLVGPVQARIEVHATGSGRVRLDLWLQAPLAWQCQRCLGPLRWLQTVSRTLLVAEPEQGSAPGSLESGEAGSDAEPEAITLARGETLSLTELLEDELLLALPFAPKHENCETTVAVKDIPDTRRDNPFAVLARLRDPNTKS